MGMNSFAHYSFGAVYQWMFETIGGISTVGPAYKRIRIAPQPGGKLNWAKVSNNSIRGLIRSEWTRKDGTFILTVEIPANTTATVHVPTDDASKITEGGKPISPKQVIDGKALFEIGSGSYTFIAPMKQR